MTSDFPSEWDQKWDSQTIKIAKMEDELEEQMNSPNSKAALVKVSLLKVKRGNLMISAFPCFLPAYFFFFPSHPDDLT